MNKPEPTTEESLAAMREMVDQFRQDLPHVVEAINGWLEAFAKAMLPVLEAIAPALDVIWLGLRAEYHKAGSPYGDTDDGVIRWRKEQGELAAAEREAEYQREHTQMYLDMRARLGLTVPPAGEAENERTGLARRHHRPACLRRPTHQG